MSNYCSSCHYDKTKKTEDNACPFNSLYWNFLDDKRAQLGNNYRMRMMYSLLDKMPKEQLQNIKRKAQHIIENQDEY
jgi:deoxyribodipyrimidine photolyase-related protein